MEEENAQSPEVRPVLELSKHGTTTGYGKGCRCAECTEAAVAYQREYAKRKKSEVNLDLSSTATIKSSHVLVVVTTRIDFIRKERDDAVAVANEAYLHKLDAVVDLMMWCNERVDDAPAVAPISETPTPNPEPPCPSV